MPDVTYTTEIDAAAQRVWDYVEDFDNWAHLMIGYEKYELIDERQSLWTLRGDVGILSRAVDIRVDITEWVPPSRVAFVVTGVTERLSGSGSFLLEALPADPPPDPGTVAAEPETAEPETAAAPPPVAAPEVPPERGLLDRLRLAFGRFVLRRLRRRQPPPGPATDPAPAPVPVATPTAEPAPAAQPAPSRDRSRLTFQLEVRPGGPMAPMLELLMSPMLEPAAEDLALGIRRALEA